MLPSPLSGLLDDVPAVVWEARGRPDAQQQRIDFVSPYVETMLGYTVEEWLSTPNFWLSIVHPDDREQAAAVAAEAFARRRNAHQSVPMAHQRRPDALG
jgi:PAS domain-containing protein